MIDFINEALDEFDLLLIDNYRISVLQSDGCSIYRNLAPIEKILEPWAAAKNQWLYRLFGQKLIWEKEIKLLKNSEELNRTYIEQTRDYNYLLSCFFSFLYDECILPNNKMNYDLSFSTFRELFGTDAIISNEYKGKDLIIKNADGELLKIQKGIKIIKLYHNLITFFKCEDHVFKSKNLPYTILEVLEILRNAQSVIRNQLYIKGNLCLSIHPLDYMTMSDNDCNWSTCMKWRDGGGDYRAGTIEMMNSPYIVVAYLTSNKPFYFGSDDYSWNNKKWRQLFFVHKDIIVGIKDYPYRNQELGQMALDWLRELAKNNMDWDYNAETYYYSNDSNIFTNKNNPSETHEVTKFNFVTNNMYNDFGTIVNHLAIVSDFEKIDNAIFNYSGLMECMLCGDTSNNFDDDQNTITCYDCDGKVRNYCSCCGSHIYNDEDVYYFYDYNCDEPYCEDCANEIGFFCPICGELHHFSEYNSVYCLVTNDVDHLTLKEIVDKQDYMLYVAHVCEDDMDQLIEYPKYFFTTYSYGKLHPSLADSIFRVYAVDNGNCKVPLIVADNINVVYHGSYYFDPVPETMIPYRLAVAIDDEEHRQIY